MKLAAAFLLFISLVAQANTTAQFAGLDQLVGHCWQATFPDGQKIDTHCFSDVYSGAFIKDQSLHCHQTDR